MLWTSSGITSSTLSSSALTCQAQFKLTFHLELEIDGGGHDGGGGGDGGI